MVKDFADFLDFIHKQIMSMNNSKFFAGLVIISLNIASKFVTIKLSKTTEMYLKYTFSRQILIFAMAWMATRDIYMALILTAVFVILADYLFNEDSRFCCFTDNFKKHYMQYEDAAAAASAASTSVAASATTGTRPVDAPPPTADEIKRSIEILERVKEQQRKQEQPNYITPFSFLK
jgi:hypothetical protein